MKYKCPYCNQPLSEDDIINGICPKCKKVIDYSLVKKIEEGYSTPSTTSPAVNSYKHFSELKKGGGKMVEEQERKNPDRLLSVVSFLIPLIGFIVGIILVVKRDPIEKRTGGKCLLWATVGFSVGIIILLICEFLAPRPAPIVPPPPPVPLLPEF